MSEQERSKAIEKALAFGEMILAKKIKHSINVNVEPHDDSIEEAISTTAVKRNKRKRKNLQILDKETREESIPKKKMKRALDEQIPAKPEGFMINSVPVKNNKPNKEKARRLAERAKRMVEQTSAGGFEVEILPKQKPSPFTVTTLKYNPSLKFGTFKDKSMFHSNNVQRESSAELLSRKKQQRKLQRN